MLLLPTPLKAFTDSMPDVKAMIRVCAMNLYGWHCDHQSLVATLDELKVWNSSDAYPASWPTPERKSMPLGTMLLTPSIKLAALKRKQEISKDLAEAGEFYPREAVRKALEYWSIELE
jgi:hypothetical protein